MGSGAMAYSQRRLFDDPRHHALLRGHGEEDKGGMVGRFEEMVGVQYRSRADGWQSGTLLTELPAAIRPRTPTQGYNVQTQVVAALAVVVAGAQVSPRPEAGG